MIRKTYDGVYFKALDDSTGEFEAVVSVFGNVDLQGDRTMPGAFAKSLASYRDKGDPIPVIWSHDWGDPFAHIGYVDAADAREVLADEAKSFGDITGGLFVKGRLDVNKPYARQVYDLLKDRRIREWSFAYDVVDEATAKDGANELNEVSLFEVGPTLKGANPATATLGVKSILDTAAAENKVYSRFERWLNIDAEVAHKMLRDLNEETLHVEKNASNQSGGSLEPDGLKWDGGAAMQSCSNASDFRQIAFERDNDSDPDTAAHWALPHHPSPGADPDPTGVGAALGALAGGRGGAPDLKDTSAARSHLEAHRASFEANKNEGAEEKTAEDAAWFDEVYAKAEFKPWHIEERDGKYCVIKDSDGTNEGCHDNRNDAVNQLRALYANEPSAASDDGMPKSLEFTVNGVHANYTLSPDPMTTAIVTYSTTGNGTFKADKAGRSISKENETRLRQAYALIGDMLAMLGDEPAAEEGKSVEADPALAELEEYKRKLGLADL